MKTFIVTEPFLNLKCGLGEGPFWEEGDNVLRFVDIVNKAVYRVNLDAAPPSFERREYDSSISVTADCESLYQYFLFGGKFGVGLASKHGREQRYLQHFWNDGGRVEGETQSECETQKLKAAKMRANDGAVDSCGRFWVSALCDPEAGPFAPEGVLFRMDVDASLHRVLEGVTIPNGMSWSLDDKTFYFTDSKEQSIFAYDYDASTGSIANRRVFFRTTEEGTAPDGHAQDVNGNLWVAIWGGWNVVCISPAGEILAEIRVPTRCVTAVAFAGEDVYITSEADPAAAAFPESARYHGSVFKCHVGVKGRRPFRALVRV